MLRSKSRSGSFGFGRNKHKSVLSRTISASIFCKGDPLISQIDCDALKPVEKNLSEVPDSSEIVRASKMQQYVSQLEEEVKLTKGQLGFANEERDRAIDELRGMKMVAQEANMKLSEALSSRKVEEAYAELTSLKGSLSDLEKELKMKDDCVVALKLKLFKAKQFEARLAERDALFNRLQEELSNSRASEGRATEMLSESKRRIEELEDGIERAKLSEAEMINSMAFQTKQFEQTKVELEESRFEIACLLEKVEKLEALSRHSSSGDSDDENLAFLDDEDAGLRAELQMAKENLARAREGEKAALSRAKNLFGELNSVRAELKLAIEAEERSKKAMDDLALALNEVAAEGNDVKLKLRSNQVELENAKKEAEQLKEMARGNEDRYKKLLDESKKETERHKNTIERLRAEAEESLLASNDKEIGFVNCIKRAEEERTQLQQENARLVESLNTVEKTSKALREENFNLRDILKQALSEANAAKEAAAIASAENSQLKDSLDQKDEALALLTRENERLMDEAAAHESLKGLKRLLPVASSKEPKTESKEQDWMFKSIYSLERKDSKKRNKAFSFDLSELTAQMEHEDLSEINALDEDPVKAEALKGSIFDTVDSPTSDGRIHRRVVSSSLTDDGEVINSDGFDDAETKRKLQRKRRPMIRRFGNLIRRKSFHKERPLPVE
ncbi:putative WEB family protein At1g65010, chloroplastic isoform X2 [Diospyros lotus]|uniref:putative WEB family protein At1g65010, chloroplastic isoform X2 n=1 Tax=Diospyros lotus TaxID=55363 RepID=UPI00224D9583|nr:putative WEB family protein At1g65010, chloroplastic isoform X2 [Diospyros lotus]